MFGTLHWNPHSKEAEFIERPHGSSNLEKNPACDRCRARKVKCRNPDNEGCTRCKRLGKKCTFTPGRHRQRGEHRVQKQHQHSLQRTSSSVSVSSSSKGSDKDEDKLPVSAPPGTAENDDSERGQQSLLDDIPPPFDLSFLADFDHETSDRDGEDTSFALFSSIFPSTQTHLHTHPESQLEPEPAPNMSMSISTTLLSPPLSSEDEMQIQHYLPPQSQDPSLFDICLATPPPLHTSLAFPPGAAGCQCLSAVIFAVEEFEASCTAGHRAELDSITAYQKEVIRRCRCQLKCSGCMARRETLVLLVFMLEKIVAACGRIVGLYRVKDAQLHLPSSSSSSSSLLVNGDCNGDRDLDLAACGAAATMSTDWRELLLGDYEISSALEWEHLVRVLIFLQLRAVMELLADVKSMGGEVLGETLSASLVQAEIRLGELEKDILIL